MERIGNLLNKAEQEKSLVTTRQQSQPSWGAILWALAQSRFKELTDPEIALWKAKLSAYPNELVEWALVNYNGEFFPNPSTICQNIERKREADYHEQANREWPAWRAAQAQAEREGLLATEEQYAELREKFRDVASRPPLVKCGEHKPTSGKDDRSGTQSGIGADVEKPVTNS